MMSWTPSFLRLLLYPETSGLPVFGLVKTPTSAWTSITSSYLSSDSADMNLDGSPQIRVRCCSALDMATNIILLSSL